MELKQEYNVLEVLHEFLVVYLTITIYVCKQIQSQGFFWCKTEFCNLKQTVLVFIPLEESV